MGDVLEDVLERQEHIIGAVRAVHRVVDGDKAHAKGGEHALQIVAHVDVVAAEAGEIFDDHAADLARAKVGEHTIEGGAVEVRAGEAVVGVMPGDVQLRVRIAVVLDHALLAENAVALRAVAVLA